MPRVHFVKKSRKEFPGIPLGSSYYWWKFRYGGIRRSLVKPKPSQLTQSAFLSQALSIQEELEELSIDEIMEEGFSLDNWIDSIDELGDECQDSLDNMPDSLQYSPTGGLLEDRVSSMEEWADGLRNIDIEFENDDEDREDRAAEILDEIISVCSSAVIE